MSSVIHLAILLLSAGVIWYFAGLLIESVNNVAKRFHKSGFTVAFFVLGFLTSISEISVMVNSSLENKPEVSAGNLVGASFVVLLLIVPLLAILGNGIKLKNTVDKKHLALALTAVFLPVLLMLDGDVRPSEGLVALMSYAVLAYMIKSNEKKLPEIIEAVEEDLVKKRHANFWDTAKIILGAIFIFIAGHMLVEEAVYFSGLLDIPASIIGLVLISIGTNIPELVIAVRSILKKKKDIAFGDYLGSTLANTFIFAVLALVNGVFFVEPVEFMLTAALLVCGLIFFYIFAVSRGAISRKEGYILLFVYLLFIASQAINTIRIAGN